MSRPSLSLRFLAALTLSAFAVACHKQTVPPNAGIQGRWQIVSLRGEALRYLGQPEDYFDFGDGTLIESFGGQRDTFSYVVMGDNLTLESKAGAMSELITSLSAHQLVLKSAGTNPIHQTLDSLKR